MAGHKVRRGDQVGRADGRFAEPQVALGQAAGLLGVVDEIGLAVQVRGMADDLDGVLVGAHRAVGPHAPELGAGLPGGGGLDLRHRQGGVGHVVHDADGEIALGLSCFRFSYTARIWPGVVSLEERPYRPPTMVMGMPRS